MALTTEEQAAVDRLADYNAGRYDATTNPNGFGGDGYLTEIPDALNDTAAVAAAVSRLAGEANTNAGTANTKAGEAADSALSAGLSARAATDAQVLSEAWATGTEPGGPGTRSAREEAIRAETAADSIAGSTVPDPAPANAGHLYGSDGTNVVLLEGVPVPTPAVGNTGLFARSTGSGVEWASLPVVGGTLVTEAVQLVAGLAYTITAPAAVTLTLPLAPTAGAAVRLMDGESISTSVVHTVARNGHTIMGLAEDMVLDTPGIDVTIWFNGSDWRLF
ncbi:MAG: hypothetical protein VR70_05365 [Rhodospirillaceae bacterium BRH_c57]|nr:MAG: hypothetical protein VR70_12550 [Rhodospirillaceae bacterium BRH_c57]KJS40218.1 MAG: hypothetical protein VR70_06185 [Rhodospirillaceae bacterium BRH_c57]KJS41177.1 MAG: hypothetical protein VR70_05365 [Rhodospirillaceae bacterium BRH_c57]